VGSNISSEVQRHVRGTFPCNYDTASSLLRIFFVYCRLCEVSNLCVIIAFHHLPPAAGLVSSVLTTAESSSNIHNFTFFYIIIVVRIPHICDVHPVYATQESQELLNIHETFQIILCLCIDEVNFNLYSSWNYSYMSAENFLYWYNLILIIQYSTIAIKLRNICIGLPFTSILNAVWELEM
jgi:hypothetical protein